jgi:signal transduction histidine kinase
LWLCAVLDGLFFREKDAAVFSHIELTTDVGAEILNGVTKVFESKEHGLWVMTDNGLYLYDYETKSIGRHGYDHESGDILISQDINALCVDKEGIVWVGTWAGGLSRYDVESGSIRTYTMNAGLPSMNIQGILEDENNGELWLSTFEGLSRFNIEAEQFNNFSLSDGIQGRLFAEGGYLETNSGYFVFGGSNGVNIFRPEDIEKNSLPPKVYITKFEIVGSSSGEDASQIMLDPTVKSNEILLGHGQNNLAIDYVGIHYANPAKNQFAYKLENYDDDWRNVGNQRSAYYNNLPPGHYVFKIKAANSNGVWSDEDVMLNINIEPPWWRTWWAYVIYAVCFVVGFFEIERALRRRVVEKQRALTRDKELAQAKEIEKAYVKLKTTQTQLVHAEKMASLGELTAGIAHEIQNPLNFVNNFAEVSVDLLDEMDEEMAEGNPEEVKAIKADLKQNLEKINFHGQRASGIVKGMLEHSRSGDGQKAFTDINVLVEEYLRLAYHGLRAKDKSFNADFNADLDESLPEINVMPQEIGRVMLNLINNAFHAVRQKIKDSGKDYQPAVTVSTRYLGSEDAGGARESKYVQITVKDNGSGIPQNVLDKIFQPFFTTKPSGEGTGLGLSLSYDIVKAHGGELKVETKEGEGTEFIIVLHYNN